MIVYKGIKKKDGFDFIIFSNSKDQVIEIPIDHLTANRISLYLSRITDGENVSLDRDNIEYDMDDEDTL
jgi:hypothetical protein